MQNVNNLIQQILQNSKNKRNFTVSRLYYIAIIHSLEKLKVFQSYLEKSHSTYVCMHVQYVYFRCIYRIFQLFVGFHLVAESFWELYRSFKIKFSICDDNQNNHFIQMYDVRNCKNAIEYLAFKKKNKFCALLLKKWRILKEIIIVLQVPYKATIALQCRSLTLSDAYGIWQKMNVLLNTADMQRICRTNLRQCLVNALNHRKQTFYDSPLLWCAQFLDPRYRHLVSRDEEKTRKVIELLKNLQQKIEFLRGDDQAIDKRYEDAIFSHISSDSLCFFEFKQLYFLK